MSDMEDHTAFQNEDSDPIIPGMEEFPHAGDVLHGEEGRGTDTHYDDFDEVGNAGEDEEDEEDEEEEEDSPGRKGKKRAKVHFV